MAGKYSRKFSSPISRRTTFRTEWSLGPRAGLKMLERLRAVFRFAMNRKWVSENPTIGIEAPKLRNKATQNGKNPRGAGRLGRVGRRA